MQLVLEGCSIDKPLTFDFGLIYTQFSYQSVHLIRYSGKFRGGGVIIISGGGGVIIIFVDFNNQSFSWVKNLWLVSPLLLITHAIPCLWLVSPLLLITQAHSLFMGKKLWFCTNHKNIIYPLNISGYMVHATFQSNCAEGLHFSAFHY